MPNNTATPLKHYAALQLPAGYKASATAGCNVRCGGDHGLTCGGGVDAQLYVDPTFADNASSPVALIRPPTVGVPNGRTSYLLGCYGTPALAGIFNPLLSSEQLNTNPTTLDKLRGHL
ncbi:hypothetical protein VTK26DRAFT_7180 [Humicola hyalothermophila]